METLRCTTTVFTISGNCLRPNIFTPLQKTLYKIYANVGSILLYVMLFFEIIDLVHDVENLDQFLAKFPYTSAMIMVVFKLIILSRRRENIVTLVEQLDKDLFLPVTKQEMEIRSKFDNIIELITKSCTGIYTFFAFGMFFSSVVIDYKGRKLVSTMWLPYDYSSTGVYLLTSAVEFATSIIAGSVSLACENVYAALMLHICCQFEILEHRFKTLKGQESYPTNQCTFHHHQIYKYADMVNDEFRNIISFQFCITISIQCFSFYRLMYADKIATRIEILCYSTLMLWQIFYYCFFGDLVKAKSITFPDVIFGSDWPSWNEYSKKVLLMVIRRSRVPIEFTSMHVVSLNLESFASLIKACYTAFNLMQSGQ